MKLLAMFTVVLVIVAAVSARRPCYCTREMNPVCGQDGTWHSNPCTMACANVEASTNPSSCGPRPGVRLFRRESPPCICTLEYAPVCGANGETYGNECSMKCAGVALAYTGKCNCLCTADYRPVCGVNGRTYGNSCDLDCSGVELDHEGEC